MRSATRWTVSTFGVLAAVAGIEHGVGEILQGNVAPPGPVFESWAGSAPFRVLSGEPALTLIPNLLVSGMLSVFLSLVFLLWVTRYIQRKHGGLILIALSLALLLVGGGFGPPLLGLILGAVATRIDAPLTRWRTRLPPGLKRFLAATWPWSYAAAVVAWLLLFPGTVILSSFLPTADLSLLAGTIILAAFTLLFTTIVSSFAYDLERGSVAAGQPALRIT